ncbi:hypothetical protein SCX11_09535 [Bifidobacterium longum]|uniref:Uncharacterized protein n=1 Tax=Bifidobacterium longum TaxID=216816 RepID=A0AAW9CGJ1_BIFLN|nr:hypothetical protein [Bifidobacterium longum]MDW7546430.1 hypothetical protein [Bifidobacterium longum]MDW7582531.1 hypothetical protein [Bifidobacterium longum]
MNVEPITVAVRDLSQGYTDNAVGGVTAYGGDLDVRPPYQREFVYRDDRRDEVVRTILKGLPQDTRTGDMRTNIRNMMPTTRSTWTPCA